MRYTGKICVTVQFYVKYSVLTVKLSMKDSSSDKCFALCERFCSVQIIEIIEYKECSYSILSAHCTCSSMFRENIARSATVYIDSGRSGQ
jgi:hypothetical protein